MKVLQVVNNVNKNNYDDDITVSDIPSGHFIAVTGISYDPNSEIRNMRVEIISLGTEHRTTQTTNWGRFVR